MNKAIFVQGSDIRPAAIRTGNNDAKSCCICADKNHGFCLCNQPFFYAIIFRIQGIAMDASQILFGW